MKLALTLASLLALALAACAEALPPPAATNLATPAPPPPGPLLSAPPLAWPACPADLAAATGNRCAAEGQSCADPAKPGQGLTCRESVWRAGELPHPPCCKK